MSAPDRVLPAGDARLTRAGDAGARAALGDAVIVEHADLAALQQALAARDLTFAPLSPAIRGLSMSSSRRVSLLAGEVRQADNESLAAYAE
jgi:hypothetical protein